GRPERGGGWRLRVPRARRRQQGAVPGRHPLPGQPVQEEGPLQGEGRAADLRDAEGARGRAAQSSLTAADRDRNGAFGRSEEHTSELQSRENIVCRLLLEKKKQQTERAIQHT